MLWNPKEEKKNMSLALEAGKGKIQWEDSEWPSVTEEGEKVSLQRQLLSELDRSESSLLIKTFLGREFTTSLSNPLRHCKGP